MSHAYPLLDGAFNNLSHSSIKIAGRILTQSVTALGKHRPLAKHRQLEIHPELARTIAATESGHGRFVLNKYGHPYSYSGFDQAFEDWWDQAGLPSRCTAHGMRKAAAALMYENGASEAELCAIFGRKIGSRMAAYYAKKYNARRAQSRALGRLPALGAEKIKRNDGPAS